MEEFADLGQVWEKYASLLTPRLEPCLLAHTTSHLVIKLSLSAGLYLRTNKIGWYLYKEFYQLNKMQSGITGKLELVKIMVIVTRSSMG